MSRDFQDISFYLDMNFPKLRRSYSPLSIFISVNQETFYFSTTIFDSFQSRTIKAHILVFNFNIAVE